MNIHYIYSLIAAICLFLLAYLGVEALGLQVIFGVILPYLAIIVFFVGLILKIRGWSRSAIPFQIPTTCGQHKSLPWFKQNVIDCPTSKWGVVVRMFLEIVLFRSLFRNTRMKLKQGPKLTYQWEIFLWVGALAFHWSFFTVIVRHLRLFTEPVPFLIQILENLDSFFRIEISYSFIKIGLPGFYLSGIVLLAAVTYLFLRRIFVPAAKYISLASDFFPLFLIMGIAISGIMMRYFTKVDMVSVKELTMGLVTLHPSIPAGIGGLFYVHIFLVSVLLAYFPFSKLMHMGGIFLSPTRNLTTNTRQVRHVNPWNYTVPVHTYAEYEDEFREKMVEMGLPVDKPLEVADEEEAPDAAAEQAEKE